MRQEQRRHVRVIGPFDGIRVTADIETPIRISDLSEGGCFVSSMHMASQSGRPIVFKMDLPAAGRLTLNGIVLYAKPEFGYAVLFTKMTDETKTRLESALGALRARSSSSAAPSVGIASRRYPGLASCPAPRGQAPRLLGALLRELQRRCQRLHLLPKPDHFL